MKYPLRMALVAGALALLAGVAQAQGTVAFTAKDVHLRAGPGRDYPIVAVLPVGYQLLVQGCLPDYRWCDVLAGASRGWVYAGNINSTYQGSTLPLLNYGGFVGIGVLGFVLHDYWNDHYRSRPWYPERDRWVQRPRVRPAPRPAPPPHFDPVPRPRPGPDAAPIGPRPPAPGAGPRTPRNPQLPGVVPHEPRREGDRRGDRPQR